ncbi:MAG: DUF4364 family protein, partial [Lachnospiraceae bacterium]
MSELFTLYKLIILYMLQKVEFPLSNGQLSEFLLEKGYTTYFTLQQALSEMVDSELLQSEEIHKRTFYHLTDNGTQTIIFFRNKISPAIKEDIHTFLKDKKYELKNEITVNADYCRNPQKEFAVHLQVFESTNCLIDLTLTVPTEPEAKIMVANWKESNQQVYASIMGT